jgi:hypothetical protein
MSCCGGARAQVGITVDGAESLVPPGTVTFEYIGRTALSVVGGVTGTRYRFEQPGIRLAVDRRDRDSLDMLPMLKQLE